MDGQTGLTVAGQQQRTVEIDPMGLLCHDQRGRHGKRGRNHTAGHDLEIEFAGVCGQGERFGQSTGLVELNVDGVITAGKTGQVGARMQAFVGTDDNTGRAGFKGCVIASR